MPSDSPSDARDHDLVAGAQAGLDLEPVAAVDAQRERAPADDVAAAIDDERERLPVASAPTAPTGTTGICGCVSTTIAPRPYMPGVELARPVVELDLGVQRARRRIERGRQRARPCPRTLLPGERVELDVGVLADADAGELALVDGDEHAQRVDARHGDDRAAARRARPASPGSRRRCVTTPVERRARCASRPGAPPARRSAPAAVCCAASAVANCALRLLQLLLRHHRLGRQLLGALVVGARERRRRLRLRERAARGGELIGQIARDAPAPAAARA